MTDNGIFEIFEIFGIFGIPFVIAIFMEPFRKKRMEYIAKMLNIYMNERPNMTKEQATTFLQEFWVELGKMQKDVVTDIIKLKKQN